MQSIDVQNVQIKIKKNVKNVKRDKNKKTLVNVIKERYLFLP